MIRDRSGTPVLGVVGIDDEARRRMHEQLATELGGRGWRVSTGSVEELDRLFAEEHSPDLVIVDGDCARIEARIEVSLERDDGRLLCEPGRLLALVTDSLAFDPFAMPVFGLDEADAVADRIEERILDHRERGGER